MSSGDFLSNSDNLIVSDSLRDSLPAEMLLHEVKDVTVNCQYVSHDNNLAFGRLISVSKSEDDWEIMTSTKISDALKLILCKSEKPSAVIISYDNEVITTLNVDDNHHIHMSGEVASDIVYLKMKVSATNKKDN